MSNHNTNQTNGKKRNQLLYGYVSEGQLKIAHSSILLFVYTDYASKFTLSWKIIIINVFVKRKILFIALDYSKCIHMHTQHRGTPTHEHSNYTKLNLHSSKQWLEMDKDSSMEQKTWQVYSFGIF